ncbi:MAG: phosphodiester glycosidase family protein [Myxococcota bacterium]
MIKGALRRLGWGLVAGGLLIGGAYVAARHAGAGKLELHDVRRESLGERTELVQGVLYRGAADAGRLVVLYTDPAAVKLEVLVNKERKKLAEIAPHANLVMNAGYFTPKYRPTGLLVSQGNVISPFISSGGPAGSGVLVVEDQRVNLLRRQDVKARAFDESTIAIQAGPRLIEADGAPGIRSDDGQHANRTFIGADARGWLILGVVYRADGGLGGGPSLFELQQLLLNLKPTTASVAFALNLDGGPSTGFHLRGNDKIDLAESGTVYSAIAVEAPW